MSTCGTCKYRGAEPIETSWGGRDSTTFHECRRVRHDTEWRYRSGDRVVVVDGSGYHAALCVEDSFGCNLWEPKTECPLTA